MKNKPTTIDEAVELLRGLYEETSYDWDLFVRHNLTEPTCPTAWIEPYGHPEYEAQTYMRYRVDADTIEAAIIESCWRAYRELVVGDKVPVFRLFGETDEAVTSRATAMENDDA